MAITGYRCEVETQMKALYGSLNEKDRRRYAAVEATKLGRGGHRYIVDLPGCDYKTIRAVASLGPRFPGPPPRSRDSSRVVRYFR